MALVALFVAGLLVALGSSQAASAACLQWTGAPPPSPGTGDNSLNSVSVLGPCNAWAVGSFDNGALDIALMERFNGSAWRQVTIPTPGTSSALEDVSPSWAVGSFTNPSTQTLILRRIGSSWAQMTSPNPSGTSNVLNGVVQLGPDNAWAVGSFQGTSARRTLILHWNGTKWKVVPSPNAGDASNPNTLREVEAVSAHDIWAVGFSGTGAPNETLTLHWNGTKWKRVPSPNFGDPPFGDVLADVAAVSANDAWAVGNTAVGVLLKGMILHWNGAKWKRVSLPGVGTSSVIEGITAVSAKNVWAVGEENFKNLVLHWNGRTWKRLSVADPGTLENIFFAIDASSPENLWAVGESRDNGPTDFVARALHCC